MVACQQARLRSVFGSLERTHFLKRLRMNLARAEIASTMIVTEMTVLTAMIPMRYSFGSRSCFVLSGSCDVPFSRASDVEEMSFILETVLST